MIKNIDEKNYTDIDAMGNPLPYTKLDGSGNELPDSAKTWTTVRDNVTGLIWEMKTKDGELHDKDNKYTWYDSNPATNGGDAGTPLDGTNTENFIKALNDAMYGGYSDWRLPSFKELADIVKYSHRWAMIDTGYFPNTQLSGIYWSSTTYADDTSYAWGVRFSEGRFFYDVRGDHKRSSFYVRAVCGGQPEGLFDDMGKGSLDNASTAAGGYTDNGSGTVTDTSTGLMWQQSSSSNEMTWEQALAYCEGLNLGGYMDWRLPSIKELRSLVDYSRYDPAINTAYFPDAGSYGYWSSTCMINKSYALDMSFYDGVEHGYNHKKEDRIYVRAVRGGQNGLLDQIKNTQQQAESLLEKLQPLKNNKHSPSKEPDDNISATTNDITKLVWRKMNEVTVDAYEVWVTNLNYEPYVYDSVLQSISWVNNLTKAIKKVEPLIGHGEDTDAIVFVETYWERLSSWKFILSSLSIARAIDFNLQKGAGWQNIFESFKGWVDSMLGNPEKRALVHSGTHFFYDMLQFFNEKRQLVEPKRLSKEVLEYKLHDDDDGENLEMLDANCSNNPPCYTKLDGDGNELPDSAKTWTTVRDNVTGLIWEMKTKNGSIHDKDNKYTWYDSNPATNGHNAGTPWDGTNTENFIKALNDAKYGGYSDWRLPSFEELVDIVIDTGYFPNTQQQSGMYWSSTTNEFYTHRALCVTFRHRLDIGGDDKSDSNYVRAVRGGQSGSSVYNHFARMWRAMP